MIENLGTENIELSDSQTGIQTLDIGYLSHWLIDPGKWSGTLLDNYKIYATAIIEFPNFLHCYANWFNKYSSFYPNIYLDGIE